MEVSPIFKKVRNLNLPVEFSDVRQYIGHDMFVCLFDISQVICRSSPGYIAIKLIFWFIDSRFTSACKLGIGARAPPRLILYGC